MLLRARPLRAASAVAGGHLADRSLAPNGNLLTFVLCTIVNFCKSSWPCQALRSITLSGLASIFPPVLLFP